MSYTITNTRGKVLMSIGEAVLDTTYGISLIGQNYRDYGQLVANNFVRLLENNASPDAPTTPMTGQLWFETDTQTLYYFDGDRFKPLVGYVVSETEPVKPKVGDQWYNTVSGSLKAFDGSAWNLIPNQLETYGLIDERLPKGSMVLWDPSKSVPAGWVICNGLNGTINTYGLFPNNIVVFIMKVTG